MPSVVSDSSTLMHLSRIHQLALLRDLHQAVTITPAVWSEVVVQGAGRREAAEVEAARQEGWVAVQAPGDGPLLDLLRREPELGDAEAECIALAAESQADLLLLDETEARIIARLHGLKTTGVVGILLRAKAEGRVQSLRMAICELRERAGFRIGKDLIW